MDHFLGKESVENILALRFANGMFEPVWNRDHIDHVQIDVPETISIEGRAGFYEGTGAFRDMVVTHLFQVLGFVAMEPPTSLDAKALRVEKNKVFEAMKRLDPSQVVRGQYEGYRDEQGVAQELARRRRSSRSRWRSTTGAGPACRSTCAPASAWPRAGRPISLAFREPPLRMFRLARGQRASQRPNELMIEFRDPGSISAALPGQGARAGDAICTKRP